MPNPRNRIEALIMQARALAPRRRRAVRTKACVNATWADLVQLVIAALPPGAEPVVEAIGRHIQAFYARPPRALANGERVLDDHFFIVWMAGLQAGSWTLPEQIPLEVLEHYAAEEGCVFRRCE